MFLTPKHKLMEVKAEGLGLDPGSKKLLWGCGTYGEAVIARKPSGIDRTEGLQPHLWERQCSGCGRGSEHREGLLIEAKVFLENQAVYSRDGTLLTSIENAIYGWN